MKYFTVDSFGADCPANWEEIADYLNAAVEGLIAPEDDDRDIRDKVEDLWERYCDGDLADAPKPAMGDGEYHNWAEFYALPDDLREGVECFWEPGYDYSDREGFWSFYRDPVPSEEFIQAVQMYDWLQRNDPRED